MTMPVLVQRQQEKATVSQLKKVYSVMNSAYMLAKNDYGTLDNWGLEKSTISTNTEENIAISNKSLDRFLDIISKYLKITSKCYFSDSSCKTYKAYNYLGDEDTYDIYADRIKLADGSIISHIYINVPDCSYNWGPGALKNVCGSFKVDLNGSAQPNIYGKDIFQFLITKEGIVPSGSQLDSGDNSFENSCLPNGEYRRLVGVGCTSWVIYNENLDYLHCSDISWDGKKKCK